jgi:hypothetical protein
VVPSVDFLQKKIPELAQDTRNIEFDHPHFKERMEKRSLSMRQILECLREGIIVSGPKKDQWGDWRVKLQRYVAGRRVQVVVAWKGNHLVVVTAI